MMRTSQVRAFTWKFQVVSEDTFSKLFDFAGTKNQKCVVQMISLCYFQNICYIKFIVGSIPLHRVLIPLDVHSRNHKTASLCFKKYSPVPLIDFFSSAGKCSNCLVVFSCSDLTCCSGNKALNTHGNGQISSWWWWWIFLLLQIRPKMEKSHSKRHEQVDCPLFTTAR